MVALAGLAAFALGLTGWLFVNALFLVENSTTTQVPTDASEAPLVAIDVVVVEESDPICRRLAEDTNLLLLSSALVAQFDGRQDALDVISGAAKTYEAISEDYDGAIADAALRISATLNQVWSGDFDEATIDSLNSALADLEGSVTNLCVFESR